MNQILAISRRTMPLFTRRIIEDHLRETSCSADLFYKDWLEEALFQNEQQLRSEMLKAKKARGYLLGLMSP